MSVLGQSTLISNIAQNYNQGAAIGIIFFYLYINMKSFMSSVDDPKPLTWIMLIAIPLNLLFAYCLIFGFYRFEGFGVFGAGLASTVIRAMIVGVAIIFINRYDKFKI